MPEDAAASQVPWLQQWGRQALRWNLLALSFAIPLGEGLAQIFFVLLAVLLLASPLLLGRPLPLAGWRHQLLTPVLVAFTVYLAAMYLPLPFSGLGG